MTGRNRLTTAPRGISRCSSRKTRRSTRTADVNNKPTPRICIVCNVGMTQPVACMAWLSGVWASQLLNSIRGSLIFRRASGCR